MSYETTYKNLLLEHTDGWLRIWLNRPKARNALSDEMVNELREVLEIVAEDSSLRGVTLRGKGGFFCAGGDLKGFQKVFQGGTHNHDDVAAASRAIGELFGRINTLPQVVVILVEGAAMAGGLGMACAGDVVAVTSDAKFALTETTLGIPPAQIAPFVVQRFGLRTARRLMLTAARFDGEEAVQLGLADFVMADAAGLDAVEATIIRQVARCAPHANAVTKALVLSLTDMDREMTVARAAEDFADCILGDEGLEGIAAFFEKRKPRWAE